MINPNPRAKIYEKYWYFAAERQLVFFRRLNGYPEPWTEDKILQQFKFCNAYRASDRVSQFLIKHVLYSQPYNPEDLVFRTILFKIFNKIETWMFLEQHLGQITLDNFNFDLYDSLLKRARETFPIYTSAYMSCANKAFGFDTKHQNHLALIEMMIRDGAIRRILEANSFKEIFLILKSYPLIGDFVAYQIATDINYSDAVNFSESDFTVAGPGAVRGIEKCFTNTGSLDHSGIIKWMYDNQEREFERLGVKFNSLWGRRLQLIDCQNLFCEVDKYTRVAVPELKSNRKKIKHKFRPNPRINYFYPPKWNINGRICERMNLPPLKSSKATQIELFI
jgi:hypothetical protein